MNEIKVGATRDLMANAIATGSAPTTAQVEIAYSIVRKEGDKTTEFNASERTEVLPGDVIKVEIVLPDSEIAGN